MIRGRRAYFFQIKNSHNVHRFGKTYDSPYGEKRLSPPGFRGSVTEFCTTKPSSEPGRHFMAKFLTPPYCRARA